MSLKESAMNAWRAFRKHERSVDVQLQIDDVPYTGIEISDGTVVFFEDEVSMPYGRCDTCGSVCDSLGCTADRSHEVALS